MKINYNHTIVKTYYQILREQGREFLHQNVYNMSIVASMNFLIDYTQHTSNKGIIIAIPAFYDTTYGPVRINVYRQSEYDGGSSVNFYCSNTIKNTIMETKVYSGATGTEKGILTESRNAGHGATNQSSGGDSSISGTEFIRGNLGKTLIEITNNSGENIELTFAQTFYEI